jgi:serine phosphatase RsbU (regulator of sigma subunit)
MDDLQVDSQAFRKALLASERRRIYGVVAFLLVFAISIAARILIFGEDLPTGKFATLVAAVCSPAEAKIELLSAGHGPLFVYSSARDTFEQFGAQAIPLGLLPI